MDADAPIYHTPTLASSSTYTYFRDQANRAGFLTGNSGGAGPVMHRGRFEVTEAIQRELEKERIRKEIVAEEMERRRILEEEVRNEMMMERELMAMGRDGGFPSTFVSLSMPPSHDILFQPTILHRQPVGLEERIAMSLEERHARGGHRREIRGFEVSSFEPSPLPADTRKQVVDLGCGTKRKSSSTSTEANSNSRKKVVKEEWSCAICEVSVTSECGLKEHLQGKKHQAKEAALIAQKTGATFGLGKPIVKLGKGKGKPIGITSIDEEKKSKESVDERRSRKNKDEFKFWCEVCEVGAFSEKVMNNHRKGKKHRRRIGKSKMVEGRKEENQDIDGGNSKEEQEDKSPI